MTTIARIDTIRLASSIFGGAGAIGDLDASAFRSGAGFSTAEEADDRIIYNTTTGALFYDADGADGEGAVLVAMITGHPLLTAGDFEIS